MRKMMWLVSALALALVLAACTQTAKPSGSTADSGKESKLTLSELFDKVVENDKNIKSFHADMTMQQNMTVGGEAVLTDNESDISMDIITEPLAMHQKINMTVPEGAAEGMGNLETESYITKDGYFLFEPNEKKWMKFPKEYSDQLMQIPSNQVNPAEQIKQLQSFAEDFSFEQDKDNFILTLKASGKKFQKFMRESVKETLPQEMQQNAEILNNITFKDIKYEILIDKNTYNPKALNLIMEFETTIEGKTLNIKQDLKNTYSDYNKLKEIKVPKEVLEAEEIDMGQ